MLKIIEAQTEVEIQEARQLFKEYAATLDNISESQNLEAGLVNLPCEYAPPSGRLLLASFEGLPGYIGCIALRKLDSRISEMDRLYVSPAFRGMGVGRILCEHLIEMAINIGYYRIRLHTLHKTHEVITLFQKLGFQEIGSYTGSAGQETFSMELVLA